MPRHTLYQLAARLDAVDAHAHITTGAHAGSFGANDLPTPTIEQAKADDYVLGHTTVQGIAFSVEQPQGSFRRGVDQGGTQWECRMAAHYGYFTGTVGADGDGVDGFIGPFPEADTAYVINQRNKDGSFDEHKVMCGFKDERHAREAYLCSYARGWTGLGAVVPLSISQLRWWLEKGNTKTALTPDQLPNDGRTKTMTKKVNWNDTLPEGATFDQVLYEARRMDGTDGLLLDSLSMADIMEDADSVHLLDALVVEYAQMPRIAERLRLVMDRSGGAVKVPAVQVSEPFKARGVTNVAAVYELSDGQTVSIFFHNPDTTPNKLATGDELVSWKWLLNKKDITIVVAPEKGQDLNPRTVAQRIMKLAEKNSAAFQKANVKRAERLGAIQTLRDSITEKEAVLKDLGASIEVARFEKVQREGAAEGKVTRMGRDFYANKLTDADASDAWLKALDSTAGDAFKAALEIYRSKLQGTFVNTVAGKVLFTGKGGSEVRGWARQRPLLAETVPFIPAILRSATTYKDEDLDKDRKGDFDFFRRFSGTQKLPSGFTVEAVVKVGVRSDGEMFYHLRAEQIAMDDAKESAPDSNKTAGADQKVGSPDLLDGYSSHLPMDSVGGDDDGVNLEIVAVWDADGNKVLNFDAQAPVALVDAAYQFANATDAFKERVAESIEETDYSPFASAKAMDMKAKELGAEIHWGMGPTLDSVGDEAENDDDFDPQAEFDACPVVDSDDGEALDGDFKGHPFRGNQHKKASSHSHAAVKASMSAKHAEQDGDAKGAKTAHKSAHYSHMAAAESTTGKARRYHRKMAKFHGGKSGMTLDSVVLDDAGDFVDSIVGKIMQGGELKGRAVIGGDGKAMVFVGESGDQRVVSSESGNEAVWGEDERMIDWLLNPKAADQTNDDEATANGKNPMIASKGTPQELIDIYQEVLPSFEYLKGIGAEVTKRVFIYQGKNVVVSSKGVNDESGGSVTVVDYLASEYWPPNGPYQTVSKNSNGENYAQVGVFYLDEDHDTDLVKGVAEKFQTESWKVLADLDRKLDRVARLEIDKLKSQRDVIFKEFIALSNEKSIPIFQKIKDIKIRASEFLVYLNGVLSDYETTARRQMDDELTYARQGTYSPEYLVSNREASLSTYFSAHPDAKQGHDAALADAWADADFLKSAISAVAYHTMARLVTSKYFTFPHEGDEVIVTDEVRAKVEAAIGEPLVEAVLEGLEGQVTLVPASKAPIPAQTQYFRYALVNRPAMIGGLPSDLKYTVEPRPSAGQPHYDMARHGILVAERELTVDELKRFELARLVDQDGLDAFAQGVIDSLGEYADRYAEAFAESPELLTDKVRGYAKSDKDGVINSVGDFDAAVARVVALIGAKEAPKATVEVYAFKDATPEALALLAIGAQNTATHSTYKTAVSVEKSADAHGMSVRWEAVAALPTFDDATGGLFGDGDSGFIRGELAYNGAKLAMVYVREDGMTAFDYTEALKEGLSVGEFDPFEDDYTGWNDAWTDVISKLRDACDGNNFAQRPAVDVFKEGLVKAGWNDAGTGVFLKSEDGNVAIEMGEDTNKWPRATLKAWIDGAWADMPEVVTEDARAFVDFPPNASEDEVGYALSDLLKYAATLQAWADAQVPPAATPAPAPAVPVDNEYTRLNAALKAAPKDRETVASDDPQAIEKLERKLYALQLRQEFMKKTNKLIKKGDNAGLVAMGFNQATIEAFKKPDFAGRIGYPDYELTNNNGVISNTRKRLEELQRRALEAAAMKEPEVPTVTEPTPPTQPTESTEKAQDRAFLMSVIDGTNPEILEPELVPKIEAAYQRNSADVEMVSLFSQAVNAYTQAMLTATAGV